MAEVHTRAQLEDVARDMRRDVVDLCHRSPHHKAHLGGSLSAIDILCALYVDVMNTGAGKTGAAWDARDRFVLSKAHAAIALYAALHQAGLLSDEEMAEPVCGPDTLLYRQTQRNLAHGMEITAGSLGMGLGYASGLALALGRRGSSAHVFAMLGDGELNEGSVWESIAFAAHNHLANLTAIVDANGLQLDGACADILDCGDTARQWESFGFSPVEVDGHDVIAVRDALLAAREATGRPVVVIAHTVKGKGLSFAENRVEWHDNILTDDLYEQALHELDGGAAR